MVKELNCIMCTKVDTHEQKIEVNIRMDFDELFDDNFIFIALIIISLLSATLNLLIGAFVYG